MSEKFKTSVLLSATGAKLSLYEMEAKNEVKGIIHVNHGMAEHAGRYECFATVLANNGYHVIAHDYRGHGKTQAFDAPPGVFSNKNGLRKTLDDILHVNMFASEKYFNLPIILFGHSMGAVFGLNYCLEHPETITGAALWNASFNAGWTIAVYKILLKIERALKGSDVPGAIAQKLLLEQWNKELAPIAYLPYGVDPQYVTDSSYRFPVSIGLWLDLLEAIDFCTNDNNLVLLPSDFSFHLQADATNSYDDNGTAMKTFADRLKKKGFKNVRLTILPNAHHENLHEINDRTTITNFIHWLDQNY